MRDFSVGAAQSVKMTLVPKIFSGSQFQVNALGLEHDPDLAPQFVRFLGRVKSHDDGAAAACNHQGRENAEHGCLAAAVWSE